MIFVQDPVCGTLLRWEEAAGVLRHEGCLFYFLAAQQGDSRAERRLEELREVMAPARLQEAKESAGELSPCLEEGTLLCRISF